ncbi:claudin-8 [Pipistrellus kuhlii]|uniref:Claudin n=1 Tax=Pipistrellus kuhlii TaxID=59472 RepID=A0A7J7QZ60_PIPKU|nr:claudin-8 [Pipistrellus kuhlii]KAF6269176.1 claudin 8 [Pipistrellus kuhlii]
MASSALQWLGLLLGGAGAVGTVAVTIMPQWKVSAFIGSNIVVFETLWEGLWMSCRSHAGLRLQCKVYDSLLALPADLQAARGLLCAACVLAALASLAAALGMRCSRCAAAEAKARGATLLAAGVLFVVVGVAVLAPVSWVAAAIVRDFHDPTLDDGRKRELGEALYLGWASALLLVAGGAVLACVAHGPAEAGGPRYHLPARRAAPRSWASERKPPGSLPSRSQYV